MRFRTSAAVAGQFLVAGQAILCRANESLPRRVQAYAVQACACRASADLHKGSARATLSAHVSDKYILWSPGKRALTGARAGEQPLLLSMERHCAPRAEGLTGESPRSLRAAQAGNASSPQARSPAPGECRKRPAVASDKRAVLRALPTRAIRRAARMLRASRRAARSRRPA